MRDAHARYMDALTRRIAPELEGAVAARRGTAGSTLERGNLRTAMRHLVDVGDADLATDIAWRLYLYWWLRGFFNEVGLWMKELLERVPGCVGPRAGRRPVLLPVVGDVDDRQGRRGRRRAPGDRRPVRRDRRRLRRGDGRGHEGIRAGHARAGRTPTPCALFGVRELPRGSGRPWGEALALIALGRVCVAQGRLDEAIAPLRGRRSRRRRRAGTRSRRPSPATTSRACAWSRARRMPPPAASPTPCASRSRSSTTRASRTRSRACARSPRSRGDVEVAATLAGAAETTRQRITMFDAEQFVYHRRSSTRRRRPTNDDAVREAMARGREMSAAEAAEFALAQRRRAATAERPR